MTVAQNDDASQATCRKFRAHHAHSQATLWQLSGLVAMRRYKITLYTTLFLSDGKPYTSTASSV
eukprot:9163457-Heterocapsa_arctica.AAC.2